MAGRLADYASELAASFLPSLKAPVHRDDAVVDPALLSLDPTASGYATAEHRRRVEKAAEGHARAVFKAKYDIKEVMAENRGYDFHLRHCQDGTEVLLEIKGTSGAEAAFYLTANEKRCLDQNPMNYRIFVVTHALSAKPQGQLITPVALQEGFEMAPLAWRVVQKV